ncbi:MAG: ABC transporter permease subunit [Planctomycetes bacterium]|nr:ABC transporter permease subunit [Planctomycetota bacterium]
MRMFVAMVPFLVIIGMYMTVSLIRHADNPNDKLTPTISTIVQSAKKIAFTGDGTEGPILWKDTFASMKRIVIGVFISAMLGLFIGLNMGILPGVRHLLLPFITFFSNVPPLAILPILLIVFGVDETAKVSLIVIGTFSIIARDIYLAVRATASAETITRGLTLGASQWGVAYRVVLPQIIPRLLDTVRICLGAAWLYLIAGEAIASSEGLGYRIFLVRRYLAMDIILPYVLWITCIAYLMDMGLKRFIAKCFPWYSKEDR